MGRKNNFRNSLAESVFYAKYAQGHNDTWWNLSNRLVDDVCGRRGGRANHVLLGEQDRNQLVELIYEMKFIPGGRYLYYAGRPAHFWNNCFGGETKVLTDKGWRLISELGQANVVSPVDGKLYPAEFKSHGKQKLNKITFAQVRGHQKHTWQVRATRQHHWALIDGTDTFDLRVGDIVACNKFSFPFNLDGFIHGFVFGDGNSNGQLRLCANKDKKYLELLSSSAGVTITYPPSANGDPVLYFGKHKKWKKLPDDTKDPEYISSFISGWLAADGSEQASNKLCSTNKDALEWFRENAAYAGIVITGELRSQIRSVKLGGHEYHNHEIFIQSYQYGKEFSGFKVIKIEPDGEEIVYCPFEPVHNRIVITHGIDTYQCYLLKCEEDTREEWANIVYQATGCLMSGGGIGVDYSILRPQGTALKHTGGLASGPLSLMCMVNEIGRHVMQGGSRRSAIWAGLNWQHGDVNEFLKCKNWDKAIGKAVYPTNAGLVQYTLKHAKMDDFNYPCQLDMTNISIQYDDAWIQNPYSNNIFLENCKQAMMTGEPGFSFNFGKKANETLRNACTEITSEDGSDVCNLGSINFANLETLDELREVVSLAAKFLICGTIRATLPYKKVYDIRERNRRLGLGIMGIHEWLLKRAYRYEVSEELHRWLEVYRDESEKAANEHCDRLYLNRPVAYRAIAPTGTIGILAGTTTGIEPVFAVAYKRRYLVDGTKWKYQFCVDSTSDILIRDFGIQSDNIESSIDLAKDYERRIKFQADVQDYVDMAISSTINLDEWGTKSNNEDQVVKFSEVLHKYSSRLRGLTCYPHGARGGQPISKVDYNEAMEKQNVVFEENSQCVGKDGICGV